MADENENAAPQYITREDFAAAMKDQQTRIAGAMDVFGDQVSKAILDIKEKPETKQSKSSNSSDVKEEAVELIDDPEGFISKVIAKNRDKDGEMESLRNDLFMDRLNELEKEYDEEYGDGSFKEQIAPDLMKAAADLPSKMRSSRAHMNMLVRGIKGGLPADKLVEKRLAVKQAQKDKEEKLSRGSEAPAMLRGVGIQRSGGDRLDADELAFIDTLNAKGIKYTKEEYLRDRKMGNDIEAEMEKK